MKYLAILTSALLLSACSASSQVDLAGTNGAGESAIISEVHVKEDVADWGTFYPYFTEDTHVLSPVLVGVAKIKQGQEIHPPHRHGDEEYLMVTKGKGIWHLNGVDSPAKEGDILFARAWDYHGITAANDSPLEFVVFKYSGRHIQAPTDPDPNLPEELDR